MLCKWIHSVYRYAKKVRDMQPNLNALSKAEKKLFEAQAMLGSKRVRCVFDCSTMDMSNDVCDHI